MKVVVASDRAELGSYVAQQAAAAIGSCLANQDECNLIVATGSSQFEVLDQLAQAENVDWSRVNGFHLDEYVGIPTTHPASFCGYLAQRFVDRVPLKSFYYLDGMLDPQKLVDAANEAIGDKSIDLLLCGIGENAHLAFNDPPADFEATVPYQIVQLDEACRRQQVGEGWFDSLEQVPPNAISMSVQQIMKADQIICSVPDRRKADAVRATVEDAISPEVPASILRNHSSATLVLDPTSASELSETSLSASTQLGETSQPS